MNINRIISGTLLISGTTIGAGMLGIPLLTAESGFIPAMIITTLVWLFMLCTGLLYLEATLWMHEGANILSISQRFFGKSGKAVAGATYIFLYYCLMIAYFAAGAPIFGELIRGSFSWAPTGIWIYVCFGLVFAAIVAFGLKIVDRVNYILMVSMLIAYAALVAVGSAEVTSEKLIQQNWNKAFFAAPVLFSAFGFHNVIPSLTFYFRRNAKVLRLSIFWGTFIPLIIYLIWQWLIIGAVPEGAIHEALQEGRPATAALQSITGSPLIVKWGQYFAFFAIVTSMLGVAFSLVDFLGDGLRVRIRTGWRRAALCAAVFVPPFISSILDPAIFVIAIGFAGGFGEAFLNGLLPVGVVWAGRYIQQINGAPQLFGRKWMLIILFLVSISVMLLETLYLLKGH